MQVVNAYEDGRNLVLLHREGTRLRRTTVPAEHVLYVKTADLPGELKRMLVGTNYVKSIKTEGEWTRIGWSDRLVREAMCFGKRGGPPSPFQALGVDTYEGDVDAVRRFFTDNEVQIQKPYRGYFDLETDSRVPFSRKEQMRILSWAVVDDETGEEYSGVLKEDTDRAERELLEEFWELIARFDQMCAWNLENFDYPVLIARSERVGCRADPRNWLWLDQLVVFRRMNMHSAESGDEKQSMKLHNIGMATVGEGKDDFDASKTWEAWEAGGARREDMRRYMLQDTRLLRKIEKKTGYLALFSTLADVCRVLPDTKGLNPTRQMDGFMLRLGMERGLHFPTRNFFRQEQRNEQFAGAFVMQPEEGAGILSDVHVCDFKSLYPSIIITWNMSPETKRPVPVNGPIPAGMNRCPLTGIGFDDGTEGVLPFALRTLLELRVEWKNKKSSLPPGTPEWYDADRRSNAYKVAANSFYGAMGSPYSRYFDKAIAESVTQNGVWLIKETMEAAKARGMKVVYGDTDSVFVSGATQTEFEEFKTWCNKDLYPRLLKSVGCSRNEIKTSYEKSFARLVFTSAKRYAGRYLHYEGKAATADSKPEVKGLEYKRGDANQIARRMQEEIILEIIKKGEDNPEAIRVLLQRYLTHVLNDELPPEEVIVSKSLSKPLNEYKKKTKMDGTSASEPPHIQIARAMKERGEEVTEGTRIEYFVVDGSKAPQVTRPAAEYGQVECDRFYLWENLIYPPSQRFLKAAFPMADWRTGFETIRPPKPRTRGKKLAPGQLGLDMALPAPKKNEPPPFEWVLEDDSRALIDAILATAAKHPGVRPFVLKLRLVSGHVALIDCGMMRVSGADALVAALQEILWTQQTTVNLLEAIICGG